MATTVDQLIVEIKAETRGLRKGLDDVNKKLGVANKTAKSSIFNFGSLAKVFATLGFVKLTSEVISTSRTFEDLNATLRAITGSAKAADASFALIREFTATTTFQLENVTEGFITLFNAGIMPTADRLKNFGNVAAAFNKDITQITRAVFNATTGEMEMLKQFGIKAKQNQDNIEVTFNGTTTVIEKSAEAITQYVEDIGRLQFPDALEQRAGTLSGAISNMQDSFSEFFNAVGEGGFTSVLTDLALATKDILDEMRPLAKAVGGLVKKAFDKLKESMDFLGRSFAKLLILIGAFGALNFATTVARTGIAVIGLAKSIGKLRAAMLLLNKVSRGSMFVFLGFMAAEQFGLLDKAIDSAMEKFNEFIEAFGETFGDMDDTEPPQSLEDLNNELLALINNSGTAGEKNKTLAQILSSAAGDVAALESVYQALDAAMANGVITQDEATAKLREFLETTGPMGKAMAQIGSEVEGLASSFSDDLTSALMEGESALESFKNFAQNVVQAVISAFMEMLVIQPIVDALLGAFNISAPKGRGGSSATYHAGGGSLSVNQPYVVGERGPELFIPNANGTLLNNMNTKNAMGGGSPVIVNQSINFATGVVPTVRAEVTRMLPQIADVTKGAVLESAMRGGSYAKGLRRG